LSALCYLHGHEKRIIHGDLKAANILFDGRKIKLTDFGDSRLMGAQIPNLSVSHSGV
jgi:serine/threonine protein kinase